MIGNNRILLNKKSLKPLRKELRTRSTSAETELWKLLRNKQIGGRKFRRQHSINNYIVDFYSPSEQLIIELDGDPHGDFTQIQKDEERDRFFEENDFKVLRFENKLVFQDPEYIIRVIIESFRH